MGNQELLREKALLIINHCAAVNLPIPQYQVLSEYAVNFLWYYEGKKHILSLYYKPNLQCWKLNANTAWGKQVIMPSVQPLFEEVQAAKPLQQPSQFTNKQFTKPSTPEAHFSDALASLALLTPFAHDNIDFSIICEQTRYAISKTLNDPTFASLNREALLTAIEHPNSTNFLEAKEYLIRCLTLCHISNVVN